MVMKRFLFVVVAIVGAGACNKPSADDCRRAIVHMQELLGTDNVAENDDTTAEVRRCKGGSSREAVACAIKATSLAELKACEFMGTKAKN
jgi:hypothetical protein